MCCRKHWWGLLMPIKRMFFIRGQADAYEASKDEVSAVRGSLQL
jgi:hypothetical protein